MAFRRSSKNKVLGGICGALAEELDISPTGLRVVFAIICLFTGIPELIYLIVWALVKSDADEDESTGTKEAVCYAGCGCLVFVFGFIIQIATLIGLLAVIAG